METTDLQDLVPLNDAALATHMNRERLLRRVMDGRISGRKIGDRWFVDLASVRADECR